MKLGVRGLIRNGNRSELYRDKCHFFWKRQFYTTMFIAEQKSNRFEVINSHLTDTCFFFTKLSVQIDKIYAKLYSNTVWILGGGAY